MAMPSMRGFRVTSPLSAIFGCLIDQPSEEPQPFVVRLPHDFGMPLHPDPGAVVVLDPLDDLVPGGGLEAPVQSLRGLMVHGVDPYLATLGNEIAQDATQAALSRHLDGVLTPAWPSL